MNMWKLKNIILYNGQFKEEITTEIRKYLEKKIRDEWTWQHNISKFVEFSEGSAKKENYNSKYL